MLKYHMTAFFLGFLLDLLLGDPYWLPHPIRLIGNLIAALDRKLLGNPEESERNDHREFLKEFHRGIVLVALVLLSVTVVAAVLLFGGYALHPYIGLVLETIMTYQILATKCLKVESMKVYACLKRGDLPAARKAVSMIVGRDTDVLDETGVARAAIETVAENTSDGVIAPMLYLALGGPVLGFFYKAVNTMDSMVGYKNDRYLYFGRAAAKLDDVVNFFPARISAYLMILSAFVGGTVVYEKNFKVLVCLRGYRFNTPLKIFFDIIYRNDNAYHTPSSLSIFRVLSRPDFMSNLALNPIALILAESRRAFVALE